MLLPCAVCYVCCAKSLQLCLTLCNPMDCRLPGSSVCGIPQARILEWVVMPFSRGSSNPHLYVSCISRQILYHYHHLGSPTPAMTWFQTPARLIAAFPFVPTSKTSRVSPTPFAKQTPLKESEDFVVYLCTQLNALD